MTDTGILLMISKKMKQETRHPPFSHGQYISSLPPSWG